MIIKIFLSILLCTVLTACSMSQPVRAPYTAPDQVQAISQSMIVGKWAVKILNPIEGEPADGGVVEYKSDGTVFAQNSNDASGLDMEIEMDGTWSIEGDMIRGTMESIRETSGNPAAKLMIPLLNALKKTSTGTANIIEASANRVVLVATEGGQAQELTRIQ